jgi:hypothetical protein
LTTCKASATTSGEGGGGTAAIGKGLNFGFTRILPGCS